MNRIFIKCSTGELLFTGFAMDRKTFESSPIEQNAIPCPANGAGEARRQRTVGTDSRNEQ